MNIKLQSAPNREQKTRMKHFSSTPPSQPQLSAFNYEYNKKRPLETDSQNVSFKGLFYKPVFVEKSTDIKEFKSKELLKVAKKHLGSSAETLFKSLKDNLKDNKVAKKLITINEKTGVVTFQKKTVLRLILDGIAYPFTTLPLDILNAVVDTLGKLKPLKKWSEKIHNSPMLKNSRQRSKLESKVNSLRGLFETLEKHKGKSENQISSELFQASVKMFDPKTGNYDTKHERSLCRVVSGAIPAFFLATDAYNLSMMYKDNKKEAEKEQKARFRQEVVRVGANAYLTLITLGAIQKYINNSKLGIMLNTGLTVLFTESIARLASGKSLTRLTTEQAKSINAKNNVKFSSTSENDKNKSNITQDNKTKDQKNSKEAVKEPLLSFNTLLKASGIIIATGFGVKGLRKIKKLDELYKGVTEPFKKLYKNLSFNDDFKMPKKDFDKIINHLKNNGFRELADKYLKVSESANKVYALQSLEKAMPKQFAGLLEGFRKEKFAQSTGKIDAAKFFKDISTNIDSWSQKLTDDYLKETTKYTGDDFINYIKEVSGKGSKVLSEDLVDISSSMATKYDKIYSSVAKENLIHLGQKDKKTKPFVDFVIAPFKFIFGVVKFPYSITEKVLNIFAKKKDFKIPPSIEEKNVKALATSIDKMIKATSKKKFKPEEFQTFVNDNILKAFNVESMSNLPNSELANLAKTSATAATIWFLMTDNYNMAMLKSNGEDVEGAKEKFKGRFVQEGSRLFYQTLLIDLFNSTFKTQYHNSLWGMSWITASNTFISEILNRKSIGMPVLPHSKDELAQIEKNKENATGFIRSYYDFMARLTGKKTLAEQAQKKK